MRIVLRQAPSPSARLFCGEAQTGTIPVSDQVDTLPLRRGVVRVSTDCLKVLVSHPEGRATIAALNSDLCILNTSGFGLDQPAEATSRPRPRSRHI
jgi:hypothetical protein